MLYKDDLLCITYMVDLLQGYASVALRLSSRWHDQVFYAIRIDLL